MTPSRSALIRTALRRGLRKRCPHCGEGRLFSRWHQLERCSVCGLVFVPNPGDTWAFTIFGDRLPVAAIIAVIYFGVGRSHRVLGLTLLNEVEDDAEPQTQSLDGQCDEVPFEHVPLTVGL